MKEQKLGEVCERMLRLTNENVKYGDDRGAAVTLKERAAVFFVINSNEPSDM